MLPLGLHQISNCTGLSFLELVPYLLSLPDVISFLSQRLCQDLSESFFELQRQRGVVHDNPNVFEFTKNTQALRVINSVCKSSSKGNCRHGPVEASTTDKCEPLPKRRRTSSGKKGINSHTMNALIQTIALCGFWFCSFYSDPYNYTNISCTKHKYVVCIWVYGPYL